MKQCAFQDWQALWRRSHHQHCCQMSDSTTKILTDRPPVDRFVSTSVTSLVAQCNFARLSAETWYSGKSGKNCEIIKHSCTYMKVCHNWQSSQVSQNSSYPFTPKLSCVFLSGYACLSTFLYTVDAHHQLRIFAHTWDSLSTWKKKNCMLL